MSSDPAETETETENANKANSEASETKHAHLLGTMILHRLLYIAYCILSIVYSILYYLFLLCTSCLLWIGCRQKKASNDGGRCAGWFAVRSSPPLVLTPAVIRSRPAIFRLRGLIPIFHSTLIQ